MNSPRQQQRAELLQRLRTQREALRQEAAPAPDGSRPAIDNNNSFPRSMTMRLLTRRHNLALLLVTEFAPLILRLLAPRPLAAGTDASSEHSALLGTPANGAQPAIRAR